MNDLMSRHAFELPRATTMLALSIFVSYAILFFVRKLLYKRQRLRKLGFSPRPIRYRIPFGLDIILTIWVKLAKNQFIEYCRNVLDVPGHTVILPILNTPIIVTEDTDNIRAVMSSQFSEFEKGETFHKIWDWSEPHAF